MPPSYSGYESEKEDNPRRVLDTKGDFILEGDPPKTLKLREIIRMVRDKLKDGSDAPLHDLVSLRPVPNPALVQRARAAMGNRTNGVWLGTVFAPGSSGAEIQDTSPMSLFAPRPVNNALPGCIFSKRFVLRRRYVPGIGPLKTMLILTDGVCLNNSGPNATRRGPRGGWSFIFNAEAEGVVSGVLEKKGPDGQVHSPTNECAELRAAIAALEYRPWSSEGWEQVVVATDSPNLVNGATALLRNWAAKDWRSARGLVQNRDLWERLSVLMGEAADGGCEVKFWNITRAWNAKAHQAAREAADDGKAVMEYTRLRGFLV